jgi:hypothetical protein
MTAEGTVYSGIQNCHNQGLQVCPVIAGLPCHSKTAEQVYRASLPGKSAGQVCRASLPGKSAGQVCRASLPGNNNNNNNNKNNKNNNNNIINFKKVLPLKSWKL